MAVLMTTQNARELRNAEVFKEEFKKYTDAGIGIILVRTREMNRCHAVLHEYAHKAEEPTKFRLWACNKGWMDFPDESAEHIDYTKSTSNDPSAVEISKAFEIMCKEVRPGVYVMYHVHHHFEKPLIQQYIADFLIRSRENDVRLVMVVPESVKIPIEIEDYFHVMDFRPPSHAELVDCYNDVMSSITDDAVPKFKDAEIAAIVQNGNGMTVLEFETAVALALVETSKKEKLTPNDFIEVILRHKTEVIKKSDMLELMHGEEMSNVGGFDLLKRWLKVRATAYGEEAKAYGIKTPRGLLCVGPPGSGKSLFAKAVSNVFAVPLVKFDIGKIFGKFVGESEGRMRAAIKTIESMAPCVLLVDEIDKGFGGLSGGGTDGGVSMRILGSFLNWMQDRDNERYPVFVVMTANNVLGLPPELMRRGRVDEIFACTFPSHKERVEILRIHLTKRGHELSEDELVSIAAELENYVGAELEGAVENALVEAFAKRLKAPTAQLLIQQAKATVPLYRAFADKVNLMNDWAKNNAKPASTGMDFSKVGPDGTVEAPKRKIKFNPIKGSRGLDA